MFTHERTGMIERETERKTGSEKKQWERERETARKTFNKHFNERPSEVRFIFGGWQVAVRKAGKSEEGREREKERDRGRGEHIMS